ncbi:hypothetical protein I0P70_05590 [Pontibacter sp. FD36]|uniref:hypothetical protein n=1 Tax=Pontibacter sp. FD36 TaxID=2789860 RepID=UPI0018AC08E0|nr:hypothetical protein [Pontibacter sp. FD36]MBF8962713.1 hypothetical protein [Pontibacter sp. FD36]
MKKTGLIFLGGLLLVSLSYSSNSRCTVELCYPTYETAPRIEPVTTASLTESGMPEHVEEQQVALTNRLLQLMDAFGKLVMVI